MEGIGGVRSCNSSSDCWGHVAYHLLGVYNICYNLFLLMLVTLGPSAMISDLITFLFLEFVVFLILSMNCMHLL